MKKLLSLMSIALVSYTYAQNTNIPEEEKKALMEFYQTTNGNNWKTKWDTSLPVEQWRGVFFKKINNVPHVISIRLNDNKLSGHINWATFNLPYL